MNAPRRSLLVGLTACCALGVLSEQSALAQNFTGIHLSNVMQTDADIGGGSVGPVGGSYVGPHSGVCLRLIAGGVPVDADNDYRGCVIDGGGDAFDLFGFIHVSGLTTDRSVFRRVETIYTGNGGDSAYRWIDTITNLMPSDQFLTVRFGGDYGSDGATTQAAVGNGYRVTHDGGIFDPPVALVWGAGGVAGGVFSVQPGFHAAVDGVFVEYQILLPPRSSVTLIHLAVLGAPSPAGVTYCINRATELTGGNSAVIGKVNGLDQITGDPLLQIGCDQPGPIANWYTPQSGHMNTWDVLVDVGVVRGHTYIGPNSGEGFWASGIGITNDLRGTVVDGGADAFDYFGVIHVTGALADRAVHRDVRTIATLCDSAWRWTDTITNTSGGVRTFDVYFGGNLGSDVGTVDQFDGQMYWITTQGASPEFLDPPVVFIWGNNGEALDVGRIIALFGQADDRSVHRSITLQPGESATFVHFALVGDRRAGGWQAMRDRAQHLIGQGRNDRLFAGVTAQKIRNWHDAPASCPGDFNKDGFVDLADLLDFLGGWNPNLGQNCP
ncbi:MAG: hypothetical protein KF768_03790 [Phycisphaeraceae bacterium]|nr:hypothetical protein [Phycisphaeraceae bacterium]